MSYDEVFDVDAIGADPDVVRMFHRATSRNQQYYRLTGWFQTNFCHLEYAIDRLLVKMMGIHDYERFANDPVCKASTYKKVFLFRYLNDATLIPEPGQRDMILQAHRFAVRPGPELCRRLIVFDDCRNIRNSLSHAMSGGGNGALRSATIGQIWGSPPENGIQPNHPSNPPPEPAILPYEELILRAAWIRVFHEDLIYLWTEAWTKEQAGGGQIELPAYRSPDRWESTTFAQLDSVLPYGAVQT